MAKEKGLFADPDRHTREHQEICLWFSERGNVQKYIRYLMMYVPENVRAEMEVPVTSATGFLYGFADIVVYFESEDGQARSAIIEVKSVLRDYGAALRQLRTYNQYLTGRSSLAVVYGQLGENGDDDARNYFGGQGVRLHSLDDIKEQIAEIEEVKDMRAPVPIGRRSAELCGLWVSPEKSQLSFDFLVYYRDPVSGQECSDLLCTDNYFHRRAVAENIVAAFNLDIDLSKSRRIPEGNIRLPCTVDLSYSFQEGFFSPELLAVHVNNAEFKLS